MWLDSHTNHTYGDFQAIHRTVMELPSGKPHQCIIVDSLSSVYINRISLLYPVLGVSTVQVR